MRKPNLKNKNKINGFQIIPSNLVQKSILENFWIQNRREEKCQIHIQIIQNQLFTPIVKSLLSILNVMYDWFNFMLSHKGESA